MALIEPAPRTSFAVTDNTVALEFGTLGRRELIDGLPVGPETVKTAAGGQPVELPAMSWAPVYRTRLPAKDEVKVTVTVKSLVFPLPLLDPVAAPVNWSLASCHSSLHHY